MSVAEVESSVVVAWGMPVAFIELTASLKAYVRSLPIITTLKLCAKRGRGPDVYINRLAPEIVSIIEAFLVESLCIEIQASLLLDYQCVLGTCELADHFDEEQHERAQNIIRNKECFSSKEDMFGEGPCSGCDLEGRKYCGQHLKLLAADWMDGLVDRHLYTNSGWQGKVIDIWKREGLPGKCLEDALLNYFGLEVVISHHHVTEPENRLLEVARGKWHIEGARITACTLILPGSKSSRSIEVHRDFREEGPHFGLSTLGFLDPNMLMLSNDNAQKFRSAVRILGLKTFSHPTQLPQNVLAPMNMNMLHYAWPHRYGDHPEFQETRKAAYEQHKKGTPAHNHKHHITDIRLATAKMQWPQLLITAAAEANIVL